VAVASADVNATVFLEVKEISQAMKDGTYKFFGHNRRQIIRLRVLLNQVEAKNGRLFNIFKLDNPSNPPRSPHPYLA
jgi:hypothetical protein